MQEYQRYRGRPLVAARLVDGLLFTSGTGAGAFCRGRLGRDVTIEQGYEACRHIALRQLAALDRALGGLGRVKNILRVGGMLNVDPSFTALDEVVAGFSDLMAEVFGDRGVAAYGFAGVQNLPSENTVAEFQMLVAVEE